MSISRADTFTITGKWLRKITDMETIIAYDIIDMTETLNTIVSCNEFDQSNGDYSEIENITVTDPRKVSVKISNGGSRISVDHARHFYVSVMERWMRYKSRYLASSDHNILTSAMTAVSNAKRIGIIRMTSAHLVRVIYAIHNCGLECTTVDSDKEKGGCMFSITDWKVVGKFTVLGLLDTLNSIAYTTAEKLKDNLFIDLESAAITCNGSLLFSNATPCENQVDKMKDIYNEYIEKWCKLNAIKADMCDFLRRSIPKLRLCNTMDDIYDTTMDLMLIADKDYSVLEYLSKK